MCLPETVISDSLLAHARMQFTHANWICTGIFWDKTATTILFQLWDKKWFFIVMTLKIKADLSFKLTFTVDVFQIYNHKKNTICWTHLYQHLSRTTPLPVVQVLLRLQNLSSVLQQAPQSGPRQPPVSWRPPPWTSTSGGDRNVPTSSSSRRWWGRPAFSFAPRTRTPRETIETKPFRSTVSINVFLFTFFVCCTTGYRFIGRFLAGTNAGRWRDLNCIVQTKYSRTGSTNTSRRLWISRLRDGVRKARCYLEVTWFHLKNSDSIYMCQPCCPRNLGMNCICGNNTWWSSVTKLV